MFKIDRKCEQYLTKFANKYELKLLILFGSQVSGKIYKESDYDIAYLSEREFSSQEEGRIIVSLMPILRVADERLINLVNIKTTSPLLLYSLTSKGQVLFEREPSAFLRLKLYAWKVFVDNKLFRNNYFRIIKERILIM